MPVALAATSKYRVTYEANASGSCLAISYKMGEYGQTEELYYAEVGPGYITMVGEALTEGPIPLAFPGSDPFSVEHPYPTDPETGTPIYPSAYVYYPGGEVSGIGSTFANWTVSVTEKHKLLLYLRPEPEPGMGAPIPFAGVLYPEADSFWIPIHYEGFNETYQQISGDGLFVSMKVGLGLPDIPEGLSWMGVMLFIDAKILALLWANQPMNLRVLNPAFPDKEVPASVVYKVNVELEKKQFSPYLYAGVVGVAVMAVIGVVVTKRRRPTLSQSLTR